MSKNQSNDNERENLRQQYSVLYDAVMEVLYLNSSHYDDGECKSGDLYNGDSGIKGVPCDIR